MLLTDSHYACFVSNELDSLCSAVTRVVYVVIESINAPEAGDNVDDDVGKNENSLCASWHRKGKAVKLRFAGLQDAWHQD